MITFRKLGKFGRFGGQLFQYAGTCLYAELNGFGSTFPRWIGNEIFNDIKPYTQWGHIKSRFLPTVQLEDVQSYNKVDRVKYMLGVTKHLPETISMGLLHRNPRDNINLYGYMQDEFSLKLLKDYKEKIKEWFTFKREIDEQYKKATAGLGRYIGLHIRWGDFVKRNMNLPLKSYLETVNKIRGQENVYIATDSQELIGKLSYLKPIRIKNPLPALPDHIFDFWILKNADIIVGGGSTFSWWAAYLGGGDYYSPPLSHLWSGIDKLEFSKQKI